MSKVHKSERWADGDTLQPDEVNAELENYVGEMNAHLDRDNADPALITNAKFVLDTFNVIEFDDSDTPLVLTRNSVNHQQWYTLLSLTIVTGDGRLELEGQATWDTSLGAGTADIGLLLNGTQVGRSGTAGPVFTSFSATTIAAPPVGPGTHTVQLVTRVAPDDDFTPSSVQTYNGRCLWARYMRR